MIEKEVVGNFILYNEKMLLLKRSLERQYGKSRWGVVSGFIEVGETPQKASLREIREEIAIEPKDLKLIKKAGPIRIPEEKKNIIWVVHLFLFEANSNKIKLNGEHLEYRWIRPEEINNFYLVTGTEENMKALGLLSD